MNSREPKTADPSGPVVLVADDDPVIRSLISDYLRTFGHHVVTVSTGAECLTYLRHSVPAVLLLDVQLPDVPGTEVLRTIRNDPTTCAVPTIIMSADCGPSMQPVDTTLADRSLAKPFDLKELLLAVESFLV